MGNGRVGRDGEGREGEEKRTARREGKGRIGKDGEGGKRESRFRSDTIHHIMYEYFTGCFIHVPFAFVLIREFI